MLGSLIAFYAGLEKSLIFSVSSMVLITAAEIVAPWAYLDIAKECNFKAC